jgi:hypothetical protein
MPFDASTDIGKSDRRNSRFLQALRRAGQAFEDISLEELAWNTTAPSRCRCGRSWVVTIGCSAGLWAGARFAESELDERLSP